MRQVIARYADRVHATAEGQHVASPLGAWLVLALAADSAARAGADTADLVEPLGCAVEVAAERALELLATAPRAVALALAAWADAEDAPAALREAFTRWPCETGAIPPQEEADDWAKTHTRGLIDAFPLTIEPDTSLLLASALVSKVEWDVCFDDDHGDWDGVPLMGSADHHDVRLWHSPVGLLASHSVTGEGLRVRSLVPVDEAVDPRDLLRLLHDDAQLVGLTREELLGLPLGHRGLLEVTEEEVYGFDRSGVRLRTSASLPAWRVESRLGMESLPGLNQAGRALGSLLRSWKTGKGSVDAAQVAVASYDRYGFEGAAVTALAVMASGVPDTLVRLRGVHVAFARPFAFVAEVDQRELATWHGVPVFSGVVTEPRQPTPEGEADG